MATWFKIEKDGSESGDLIRHNSPLQISVALVNHVHSKLYNNYVTQIRLQNCKSGRRDENKLTFRGVWYYHLETFMFWEYFDLRKKSKVQTEDELKLANASSNWETRSLLSTKERSPKEPVTVSPCWYHFSFIGYTVKWAGWSPPHFLWLPRLGLYLALWSVSKIRLSCTEHLATPCAFF